MRWYKLGEALLLMGAGWLMFALGAVFGASLGRRARGDPLPLFKIFRGKPPDAERTS